MALVLSYQPSVKRDQLESLHTLSFIERRENVVFLGPPGVGKTHLAFSHAVAAAEGGRRVYYATLADLITSLEDAQQAGRLSHRLRTLVFPSLMILDDIGYLPISRTGAILLFQLMSRRYEHASTVLISNTGFEEWDEVLGDEVVAGALIDRLLQCLCIAEGRIHDIYAPIVSRSSNSRSNDSLSFSPGRWPISYSLS